MKKILAVSVLAFAAACGGAVDEENLAADQSSTDVSPSGVHHMMSPEAATGAALTQAGIAYHGGPVMTGTKHIYYIWYGNWSGNSATTILTDMAKPIGGTPYFNINTTYTNSAGTRVSNSVTYNGSTTDNYSMGTSLTDAEVRTVVANAI